MRRAALAAMILATLAISTGLARAEVSKEQIDAAVEKGVQSIVAGQQDDGHWIYMDGKAESPDYKVGYTGLMVLALQHSRSKTPESNAAIKKGLSYNLQHDPEPRTYSAGVVEQVLYFDRSTEHSKWVGGYAWMLCSGQMAKTTMTGIWTYGLPKLPDGWARTGPGPYVTPGGVNGDGSNGQFGILGITYAEKSGYQIPRVVWERAAAYYTRAQHEDGGWDYQSDAYRKEINAKPGARPDEKPYLTMTLTGTVSIYLCEEALADKSHKQCATPAENKPFEAGLKWIGSHWSEKNVPYTWYACERLGLLTGYGEFGGHDWYQEGAKECVTMAGGGNAHTVFAQLFLARGRTPIIINKLKRKGDWNLHRFDVGHLIDHISGPWQIPCQWRIVTLEPPVEFLLKVPILWISGHESLKFTPEEKAKLKEYVEKGGTILGEDCCSRKPFDDSFRAMVKELWPENNLTELPKSHAIFTSFRKLDNPPKLEAMALEKGQGRLGVIYIPHGISCKWEVGGPGARTAMDAGACVYLYVEKIGKATKSEEPAK